MAFTSTYLDNTYKSIFTSTDNNAITAIYFCNISTVPVTISVCAVPRNQLPDLLNTIYYEIPIAPKDTFVLDTERLILEHGDALFAIIPINFTPMVTRVIATVSTIGI